MTSTKPIYLLVVLYVILVISYVVMSYTMNPNMDSALLLFSICALIWASFKTLHIPLESFKNSTKDFLQENFASISKNLVQYFTVFDKDSYEDGKKEWKNIVNIKGFNCDTSMRLTKPTKFYVQTGLELGGNSLIGPLSNTMNIRFGNPYTICLAVSVKQLIKSKNAIELFKMYANSSNNNGIRIYISPETVDMSNGANSGSLYFQFADKEPVLCRVSTNDNKMNFPQNTLLFFVIVRQPSKVQLLMLNEKTDKLNEIASVNVETTDVTFSNKELVINRYGNWDGNIYNIAFFNNALDDIRVTTYYMYIKDLYTKYNNPAYLDALKKYTDSLKAYTMLKSCPFPADVCKKCTSVDDWSNFSTIINAPTSCKQSIAKYCSNNPKHPFCECWNKSSPKYTSTTCTLLRALYMSNKNAVCEDVCSIPKERSILSSVNYPAEYTFDKIKITYPLTSEDKILRSLSPPSEQTKTTDMQVEANTFWQRLVSWFV
jgi:hypothetical protein